MCVCMYVWYAILYDARVHVMYDMNTLDMYIYIYIYIYIYMYVYIAELQKSLRPRLKNK